MKKIFNETAKSFHFSSSATLRAGGRSENLRVQYQFGRGISKMVGPKKQGFCPKINMVKGKFDTNYFEPLMIFSS